MRWYHWAIMPFIMLAVLFVIPFFVVYDTIDDMHQSYGFYRLYYYPGTGWARNVMDAWRKRDTGAGL